MLRIVLVVSFVIGSAVMWLLHGAAKIGVGYAAKQVCSGVFISHLPVEFTLDKDVLPRLATVLGMDRFVDVETGESFVTANLLTASATASYRDRYVCTLHSNEPASFRPHVLMVVALTLNIAAIDSLVSLSRHICTNKSFRERILSSTLFMFLLSCLLVPEVL